MTKQLSRTWQVIWVVIIAVLCLVAGGAGTNYHQQKVWHRFAGTYYAYVADNGVTHKVKLTIPQDHRVATLKIVDSTQGISTHVTKVNHLKINQECQTMAAIGYPGMPKDHYRHVGTTIKLTTSGVTRTYYRAGTPAQRKHEEKFQN